MHENACLCKKGWMAALKTNLTLVGLGLMGGSMALALKGQEKYIVRGVDIDPEVIEDALLKGAIQEGYVQPREAFLKSDWVVLCLHPLRLISFLKEHAAYLRPGTVVTDITGVKCEVMADILATLPKDVVFVPGHPMAGRECGGWKNATDKLFEGRHYIFTPLDETEQADVLDKLRAFALDLGCRDVIVTTPKEHDVRIAFTSQMMHVLAAAVCDSPVFTDSRGFEGGSLQDVTRVANLDAALWSELMSLNREALCQSISVLEANLAAYRECIQSGTRADIEEKLAHSAGRKRAVLLEKAGC